jgi:hypothetical protein
MTSVLTCLGILSVLLLTSTVTSGFVSNGYHIAYARGNLDALGTKIRESINNQITEQLSGSAGPNPSSSSGSSPPSPSSDSSGLTTPTPTILSLSVRGIHPVELLGMLKTNTGFGVSKVYITFTYNVVRPPYYNRTETLPALTATDALGSYNTKVELPDDCSRNCTITAHYAGGTDIIAALVPLSKSDSSPARPFPF